MKTRQLTNPPDLASPTVYVIHDGPPGIGSDRNHTVGTDYLLNTWDIYPLVILSPTWSSAAALAKRLVADPDQITQACIDCNRGRRSWHVPRWNRLRSPTWYIRTPAVLGSLQSS